MHAPHHLPAVVVVSPTVVPSLVIRSCSGSCLSCYGGQNKLGQPRSVKGFDHIDEADAERMESLEVAILSSLDIPDPYADRSEMAQG